MTKKRKKFYLRIALLGLAGIAVFACALSSLLFVFTDTAAELTTPSIEERVIGEWAGAMTNKNNDKIPATWTFLDGGIMLTDVLGFQYGSEWYIEGNRLHIISELHPNDPTYRDIEFVADDVMILTKEEAGIKETWTRVEDEESE